MTELDGRSHSASSPGHERTLQVLVVAYGPAAPLKVALGALQGRYPLLVVDNSSSEATRAASESEGAQYLDPGSNLGFAAGVNLGLDQVQLDCTDVLLLNPDARIDPEDVDRLRRVLDEERVACVAPSYGLPGSADASSPWWPWVTPSAALLEAIGVRRVEAGRGFLSGAVLVMSGTALLDVGLLDERFFLYAEDQDWQRRALALGWKLRHCPQATATHVAGGTDSDIVRLQLRLHASLERYVRKWYGWWGWTTYRCGVLFGQSARWLAFSLVRRRPETRRAAARLCRLYLSGPERKALSTGAVPSRALRSASEGR